MTSHRSQILKEFWPNFNATENDFKNPTQSFVMKFYDKFFDECALLELLMEPVTTTKVLYPAMIKESLPIISNCVFLKIIFSMIKGSQFGLEDIIEPNQKRASKQIEMLTNFLAYVDCHAGPFSTQAMADSDDRVLEKERFAKETEEFKEKLNECAIKKTKYAAEIKLCEDGYLNRNKMWNGVLSTKAKQDAEYEALSATISEKDTEMKALEMAIQKEMEEIQTLQEKIVLSPDAVSRQKAELIMRKREVEAERMSIINFGKEKNRLDTQLEELTIMIYSKLSPVQDLVAKLTFSRDLENGLELDKTALNNAKEKDDAASEKMHATERLIAQLDGEEKEFKAKCDTTRSSLEKSIQQVLNDKLEAEAKQLQLGAKQVIIAQEIDQWMEKIASVKDEKDGFMKCFNEKEEEVNNAVTYFQDLLNSQTGEIMKNFNV